MKFELISLIVGSEILKILKIKRHPFMKTIPKSGYTASSAVGEFTDRWWVLYIKLWLSVRCGELRNVWWNETNITTTTVNPFRVVLWKQNQNLKDNEIRKYSYMVLYKTLIKKFVWEDKIHYLRMRYVQKYHLFCSKMMKEVPIVRRYIEEFTCPLKTEKSNWSWCG